MNRIVLAIGTLLLMVNLTFAGNANNKLVGVWFNEEKSAKVEIYECDGEKLCGKIVWLEEPLNDAGQPRKDVENPDETLQKRPLMGLLMLDGFIYDEDDEWEDGTIYDPKKGKTYSCNMELLEPAKLKVRGYIGISIIGKTTYWTKAN